MFRLRDRQREMLREIEQEVAYTAGMTGRRSLQSSVIRALEEVPRHRFVPAAEQNRAYVNGPLPIGHGQTISQPYIVAIMTDLLDPEPQDRILEVGTGSGYQAAVLSRLVHSVYTLEIIRPLQERAADRLQETGCTNVHCRCADGYYGWPEEGPYDGIIVTAAAVAVPPPLLEQLKPDANLVIPVGAPGGSQELMVLHKDSNGEISARSVLGVIFVPLTGGTSDPLDL